MASEAGNGDHAVISTLGLPRPTNRFVGLAKAVLEGP